MGEDKNIEPAPEGRRVPSKDTLNLVIAICAVLISAASFVAAYMQSDAAYRQVKAETWPFLQLGSGNYSLETRESALSLKLHNAGVGPANIKSLVLSYEGKPFANFWGYAALCCTEKGAVPTMQEYYRENKDGLVITSSGSGFILPAGEERLLFNVPKTVKNEAFWQKLDRGRWKITGKSCYCSLLGECMETDFINEPVAVKVCTPPTGPNYDG
ncbi:MAG: hypothetical protein HWE08_14245 [Alphaproteobacteria bacterium]|nr:hypothetical protein [Alphaproteobacteria bacterium]